jgi:hypothetical protein
MSEQSLLETPFARIGARLKVADGLGGRLRGAPVGPGTSGRRTGGAAQAEGRDVVPHVVDQRDHATSLTASPASRIDPRCREPAAADPATLTATRPAFTLWGSAAPDRFGAAEGTRCDRDACRVRETHRTKTNGIRPGGTSRPSGSRSASMGDARGPPGDSADDRMPEAAMA